MSPALTKRQRKRLLKKEKAIKHREDATRRQTERAQGTKTILEPWIKNESARRSIDMVHGPSIYPMIFPWPLNSIQYSIQFKKSRLRVVGEASVRRRRISPMEMASPATS